jgi:hypothetical protein
MFCSYLEKCERFYSLKAWHSLQVRDGQWLMVSFSHKQAFVSYGVHRHYKVSWHHQDRVSTQESQIYYKNGILIAHYLLSVQVNSSVEAKVS